MICHVCGNEMGTYHTCPGPRPPDIAGDQMTWTSTSAVPWPCNACAGTGVLWR